MQNMEDSDLMFNALLADARNCIDKNLCETVVVYNPVLGRRPEKYLVRRFLVEQLEFMRDAGYTSSRTLNANVDKVLKQPLETRERLHVAAYKDTFLDGRVKANAMRMFSNTGRKGGALLLAALLALLVAVVLVVLALKRKA
jgi:hypothetical protein